MPEAPPAPVLTSQGMVATAWSAADILLRNVLQLGITVALARLLTPQEFGTVALLALFLGIATVLADGGFGIAVIQRQDITHEEESTAFWINLAVGAALSLGLGALAPVIAAFYNQPVLKPLTVVMSLNVFLSSLGVVHLALLTRRLDFRVLLKISAVATMLSGTIAVWMAWQGFGVWALAAQSVVMTGCTTALLWLFNSWRPALTFNRKSARSLFTFGGYMLAAHLMDTSYTRLYTVLLGKLHGVRELGFYVRADGTQQLLSGSFSNIVSRVALPVFSATANDQGRLRRGVRTALRGLMLVNAPIMLGAAAVAAPLVSTLFGTSWAPAVPILQVLCLAGLLLPLHVLNLNVLTAQGHSRLLLRLEVVKKSVGVVLLILGALQGIMGVAWAYVLFSVIAFGINAHYTRRFLGYGVLAQLADVLPIVALAVPMAIVINLAANAWHARPLVELLVLSASGAALFILAAVAVRLGALRDLATALGRGSDNELEARQHE